jgi:hypothetical protein
MVCDFLREFYEVCFCGAAGDCEMLSELLCATLDCYEYELPSPVAEGVGPWEPKALHVVGASNDVTDSGFKPHRHILKVTSRKWAKV